MKNARTETSAERETWRTKRTVWEKKHIQRPPENHGKRDEHGQK
jgi:hypothetical protein